MSRTPFESCPIFIGGEGRSGTTLLSLMLDAHPRIACGPELHFRGPRDLGPYVLGILSKRMVLDDDGWEALRSDEETYPGFHFVNRCHRCGIDPADLGTTIEAAMAATSTDLVEFDDRAVVVEAVGEQMRSRKDVDHWGLKIMTDLRVSSWYRRCWPNAVFVHLIRDGRDVAASQLHDHSGWGYGDVRIAAERWKRMIEEVDAKADAEGIVTLRYEDLVRSPREALAPLFDRINVDWDESCASHEGKPHALYDHPYRHPSIEAVRRPRNEESIGRWRRDLSTADVEAWLEIASDVLVSRGYEP